MFKSNLKLDMAGLFTKPFKKSDSSASTTSSNDVRGSSVSVLESDLSPEEIKFLGHDMKSPIQRIDSIIDLMVQNPDGKSQHEYLDHITAELKNFQEMLNGFSNLKEFDQSLDADTKFSIHSFFGSLYSGYKKLAKEKDISLLVDIMPSSIVVITNYQAFCRIVDNLLSNAVKFTQPGGKVNVEIRAEGKTLTLKVKDDGPGISKSEQKVIFEKFKKGSAQPTSNESSSGIGLYLVKKLADSLKATIRLESEPKKGACFEVVFPDIVNTY